MNQIKTNQLDRLRSMYYNVTISNLKALLIISIVDKFEYNDITWIRFSLEYELKNV